MLRTKTSPRSSSRLLSRHIALPSEHGAWVFLLSPLLVGLFAAGRLTPAAILLVLAAMSAFLVRQPVTIAVKVLSGRRPKSDWSPALFWMLIYGGVAVASAAGLLFLGYGYILWLGLPAAPLLAWHLWLVSRRAERRAVAVEVAAGGALALAAPAAYWIGLGAYSLSGWLLWGLCWAQTAGSIVYAYLRLEQRRLKQMPAKKEQLRMARGALLANSLSFAFAGALALTGWVSPWLPAAFTLQWLEALYGALRPAIAARPASIGFRQLAVSSLFTLVFIIAW